MLGPFGDGVGVGLLLEGAACGGVARGLSDRQGGRHLVGGNGPLLHTNLHGLVSRPKTPKGRGSSLGEGPGPAVPHSKLHWAGGQEKRIQGKVRIVRYITDWGRADRKVTF